MTSTSKYGIIIYNEEKELKIKEVPWSEYLRKRYQNDPRLPMYYKARLRAKAENLDFTIEKEDITIPEYCPILGIKLGNYLGLGVKGPREDSPSLDRVDVSKGYIKGNVCVISHKANWKKRDLTIEELEAILKYMKERIS